MGFNGESEEPVLDETWTEILNTTWDEDLVDQHQEKLHDPSCIDFVLDSKANKFRKSIFVHGDADSSSKVASFLRRDLGSHYVVVDMQCWLPGVRMLAITPATAGKGLAAEYIRKTVGFSPKRCMWAGDTRGDSSMLATPMFGVLVGNATLELQADAAEALSSGRVHQAVSKHAGGILEGMRKHNLE